MGKFNVNMIVREHVTEKLKIELRDFSCHLNKYDSLEIIGGVYSKEGYKDINGYCLKIKADVLDNQGCILSTSSSWSDVYLEMSGYDSFELTIGSHERWYDLTEIAEIKIYGVYRKKA